MKPTSINEELYEKYQTEFGDIINIDSRLFNLVPEDVETLARDIIIFYEKGNMEANLIYRLVSIACSTRLHYIAEYWKLFEILMNELKVEPVADFLISAIQSIYGNKYKLRFKVFEDNNDYIAENFPNKTLQGIFDVYEPNTLKYFIFHDDLKSLKNYLIESGSDCDVNFLAKFCCRYGSVECFRFLRSNGAKISKNFVAESFMGQNKSIIEECLAEFPPGDECMRYAIKNHKLDDVVFLCSQHNININLFSVANFLNFPLFLFVISSDVLNIDKGLICSCSFGNKELAEYFLERGANVNAYDEILLSPLMRATKFYCPNIVEFLVKKGAKVNQYGLNKITPLHLAAESNSKIMVKKLIELGAEIEALDYYNNTPLQVALFESSDDAAVTLIEHGAKLDNEMMFRAFENNNTETMLAMIGFDFDHNMTDSYGETLLSIAATNNNPIVLQKLIDLGLNIEHRNLNDQTPLISAANYDAADAIKVLCKAGAEINATCEAFGNTALIDAVSNAHYRSACALIEAGADINIKNKDQKVAADYAFTDEMKKLFS